MTSMPRIPQCSRLTGALLLTLAPLLMLSVGTPAHAALSSGSQAGRVVAQAPQPVTVTQPQRRSLTRSLEMPASLRADQRADLFAYVSGYVKAVHVDIGSDVRAGDKLLDIDVPEMKDDLRRATALLDARRAGVVVAEAAYDLQQITSQRQQELAREQAISQQALDEALGQLTQARATVLLARSEVAVIEAQVARLQTLLEYASVKAPFNGVITERGFDPGAFVRSAATEGQMRPLFSLVDLRRIRIVLDIPESDAPFVRPQTPLSVTLPALGVQLESTVSRTSVALDPKTRTMRVEADLDNANRLLAPGMYARVTIGLEAKENALLLPSQALRVSGEGTTVLVARHGVAEAVRVEPGYDDGRWTEILGGPLQPGDQVISAAHSSVVPGSPVKPVSRANPVSY